MNKKQIKKMVIKELSENPIGVRQACKNVGIHPATLYRWKAEDPEFAKRIEDARRPVISMLNDLAESVLYKKIEEGSLPAVMFHLKHNHENYKSGKSDEIFREYFNERLKLSIYASAQPDSFTRKLSSAGLLIRMYNEHLGYEDPEQCEKSAQALKKVVKNLDRNFLGKEDESPRLKSLKFAMPDQFNPPPPNPADQNDQDIPLQGPETSA